MRGVRLPHLTTTRTVDHMTRTALVTGATKNLGLHLAAGLAAGMAPDDRVLVTGRDDHRLAQAIDRLRRTAPSSCAALEPRLLDVRDADAIDELAAELGPVDIVVSNAAARMSPDDDPADLVDAVADTNNHAAIRMLRAFAPQLRPGGRLLVVASALGTLDKVSEDVRAKFAAAAEDGIDAVDALVTEWRDSVVGGRAVADGYGSWLNIPSKVAQVAAVRAVAAERRSLDLPRGVLVAALCPGLIDTAASRPWFADMSSAQTPAEAAAWPVELALAPTFPPEWYGELLQFGRVIPWETGMPVPHRTLD